MNKCWICKDRKIIAVKLYDGRRICLECLNKWRALTRLPLDKNRIKIYRRYIRREKKIDRKIKKDMKKRRKNKKW